MVERAGTQSRPCPSRRRFERAGRLAEGSQLSRAAGSRICHADHSPAPPVLTLTIGVVLPTLRARLVAAVDLSAPEPPSFRPAAQAAIRVATVARTADVEQPAAPAVPAQALPQNHFQTA